MEENIEQQKTQQENTTPAVETPTPVQSESAVEPTSDEPPSQYEPIPIAPPVTQPSSQPITPSPKSFLAKALESIQFRKKAKLEKIMKLANEKKVVTNDDVEKLIRVSDATATRYLNTLVKQNKLKVSGNRRSAQYEPIIGSDGGN